MGHKSVKTGLFLSLLLIVFSMSFVTAATTEINIQTISSYKVSVFVLAPTGVYSLINSYHVRADTMGYATIPHTSAEDKVNIKVKISKPDGTSLITEDFNDITTGSPLYFRVIPGDISTNYKAEEDAAKATEVANVTEPEIISNVSNVTQEETAVGGNSSNKLTGLSFKTLIDSNTSRLYYILGGILVVLVLAFLIYSHGKNNPNGNFGLKLKSSPPTLEYDQGFQLKKAEEKIKKLETELNTMKNQEKIKQVERKLQEDKDKLERLRKGEDISLD